MIRSKRWTKGNLVLIGDAKATAHFSIGSGTKLAMEDAIALFEAITRSPDVETALARYETGRREEVEKTQHAADVSLVWFEHLDRFWHFDPVQFAFGVMTRSKAITYDNLRLRAPDFVKQVDRTFAEIVQREGFDVDLDRPVAPMFQPLRLRELVIPNRAVLSPMCMYSAVEGVPDDFHLVHYGSRAVGGAGLIFTEMTCVSRDARITPGCTGLWNDEQEASWRRIVDFVHARSGSKICLQLGHAGRKGASKLMWDGMDRPLEDGGWDIVSASPVAYFPDSKVPRELDRAAMDRIKADFVAAVVRAERCGFDMIEMHAAHGYLLASFLSPLTNHRRDEYGGSLENRLRFPVEVFEAMREAWPAHKPMSVRLSATDWAEGGITPDDSVEMARAFAQAGVDLVDVSTGQTVHGARPIYGRMFQTPFSDQIRNEASVRTMCVGNITTGDQINTILAAGRADLVALGRPHLVDPGFTMKAAAWYGADSIFCPPPTLRARSRFSATACATGPTSTTSRFAASRRRGPSWRKSALPHSSRRNRGGGHAHRHPNHGGRCGGANDLVHPDRVSRLASIACRHVWTRRSVEPAGGSRARDRRGDGRSRQPLWQRAAALQRGALTAALGHPPRPRDRPSGNGHAALGAAAELHERAAETAAHQRARGRRGRVAAVRPRLRAAPLHRADRRILRVAHRRRRAAETALRRRAAGPSPTRPRRHLGKLARPGHGRVGPLLLHPDAGRQRPARPLARPDARDPGAGCLRALARTRARPARPARPVPVRHARIVARLPAGQLAPDRRARPA
jgi:2,4-dienoyl-CoA reductase-like NADH-dependent reductase (Old Yellow Enzyme family)